jgi:hypothetical protein
MQEKKHKENMSGKVRLQVGFGNFNTDKYVDLTDKIRNEVINAR